jgi:L-fuconolactonase
VKDDYENNYRGSLFRTTSELQEWHAKALPEDIIEPRLPIVDPHHHTYDNVRNFHRYGFDDLRQDLDVGHRVVGTVYVEGYGAGWLPDGPEHLRPVGEVIRIAHITNEPLSLGNGHCHLAAGVIAFIDLTLEEHEIDEVLQAYREESGGRLCGVRHRAVYDPGIVGRYIADPPKEHVLADPAFRRGFARLASTGLSFDAWLYHPQLPDLVDLAEAFPGTSIILNHAGGLIGVGDYARDRSHHTSLWKERLRTLASLPNVFLKVGGFGMPVFGFGFEHKSRPPTSQELANAWKPLIDSCVEAFGTERCMLESNFPVDKQSCGYKQLWNAYKLATQSLTSHERSDLFHDTACRIYRLNIEGTINLQ